MDHGQWDDVYSPFGGAWDEDDGCGEVTCPSCGHEQDGAVSILGTLGNLEHHRCRYCGFDFSVRAEQ